MRCKPFLWGAVCPAPPVVYETLRAELLSGARDALDGRVGVSRRAVMDAMMRLELAGFIEIIRQVGFRVVVPDPVTVHEHFYTAAVLEGAAARPRSPMTSPEVAVRVGERARVPQGRCSGSATACSPITHPNPPREVARSAIGRLMTMSMLLGPGGAHRHSADCRVPGAS